ncbi:hypothetical protein BB559_000087 [Furculomyces boomerangus]|uniref:Mitochondrial GTPase 1 n=1 Tax=Furculomyces boomerangus TaxID=61424 RepID=A0A2T9Z6C2_9FUNG|nr:hypothetical protein BB559_000087 [Furculomyces boomerangus]
MAANLGFRNAFTFQQSINWFPGHMTKGLRKIKETLRNVDLIVELRDSRVPISSINYEFEKVIGRMNRLVVYNKVDLIPIESQKVCLKLGTNVAFSDCRDNRSIKTLLSSIKEFSTYKLSSNKKIVAMVVGMPNVGKSSIINAARQTGLNKGKAAKTGSLPGVTRNLSTLIKVFEDPDIYIYDTPGVMMPFIPNPINSLKVALTGGIKDDVADVEIMADYLLYRLNQFGSNIYVEKFGLEKPTDDISFLLNHLAKRIGALQSGGIPQLLTAANFFLTQYRMGKLGKFCLDEIDYDNVLKEIELGRNPEIQSKNKLRKESLSKTPK